MHPKLRSHALVPYMCTPLPWLGPSTHATPLIPVPLLLPVHVDGWFTEQAWHIAAASNLTSS
jgi:hypothetical protein